MIRQIHHAVRIGAGSFLGLDLEGGERVRRRAKAVEKHRIFVAGRRADVQGGLVFARVAGVAGRLVCLAGIADVGHAFLILVEFAGVDRERDVLLDGCAGAFGHLAVDGRARRRYLRAGHVNGGGHQVGGHFFLGVLEARENLLGDVGGQGLYEIHWGSLSFEVKTNFLG